MNDQSVVRNSKDVNALSEDASFNVGVLNGNFTSDLFQQIPCVIGFTYTRFDVDGNIKPCCVAPMKMGNINTQSFEDVWHSNAYYVWRAKFLKIHKKKFHLHDPEFAFCQFCPHVPINLAFTDLILKK